MTAEAALKLKGLAYVRIDLAPREHRAKMAEIYGEGRTTVPGLLVDGRPVHGSRRILEQLETLESDPPPYPAPIADAVREAERIAPGVVPGLPGRRPGRVGPEAAG